MDKNYILKSKLLLLVGGLNGIRSVADVSTNINAEVSSDGSWGGAQWVGLSEHGSSLLDDILSLPNHGDNGSASHVLDKTWEEGLGAEVSVVLLEQLFAGLDELQGDQLVPSLLESLDDLSNESSLDTVWLDHDEGSLLVSGHLLKMFLE